MINQIINGNSIEILKTFSNDFVHTIISDIPYGISIDDWDILHNNTNSALGGSSSAQVEAGGIFKRRGKPLNGWSQADKNIPLEYQNWCSSWAKDWYRVLKPGGTCFIFAGRRLAHRCIIALEDVGFTFKDMLSWEKNNAPYRAQRVSSIFDRRKDNQNSLMWQGWRVANLPPYFEPILWFQKPYKTGGTIVDNILENNVGAWNEASLLEHNIASKNIVSNILKVNPSKDDKKFHIAQKPINLMKLLIELVTVENQIVLDPFMGSGTTCVAAKQLNRKFIGIDINSDYCNIAKQRLNKPHNILLKLAE